MRCYLSRLDVRKDWLMGIGADTHSPPHPTVRRSRSFNLKISDERQEFILMAAHLIVEQMNRYHRHHLSGLTAELTENGEKMKGKKGVKGKDV